MIERHWFILLISFIGMFSPKLAFTILFGYMTFILLVQNGYIAL